MNPTTILGMFNSTGSGCSICGSHVVRAGAVALCLLFGGMSAPATASTTYQLHVATHTTSGPQAQVAVKPIETTAMAVMEVRRRSDLTWDELGGLFGVSRRNVHLWANGQAPSAANEGVIRQTLTAIRHLDQGSAADTRALLFTPDVAGVTALDLLRGGQYQEAMTRAGDGAAAVRAAPRVPLSQKALEARRPISPELLLGAVDERIVVPAKARIARVVRVPKTMG